MLVLTRKQKESIKIGDDITITILRVNGNAVKVGIEAPNEVRVLRGELSPRTAPASESADEELEPEPQVISFRFNPAKPISGEGAQLRAERGPLASLMATLHSTGVVEASAP